MHKTHRKRIEKIEGMLHLSDKPKPYVMLLDNCPDSEHKKTLPENVEEWLTYQQKVRDWPETPLVLLLTSEELYARGLPNGR